MTAAPVARTALGALQGMAANGVRLFLMAPNYVTGRQVIAAVKGQFKGQIAGEIYTGLDQTDFSAEIAQIRAAKPDAIYEFEPGGLGIVFLKQFAAAGLTSRIPLVVAAPSLDPHILAAVGNAARNMHIAADWNVDFPNEASRRFVADFRKTYGREPTIYAAHGYDTARLLGSALKATGGTIGKGLRAALLKADFPSVRGSFSFATNQAPILNWYELGVFPSAAHGLEIRTIKQIRSHVGGAYARACHMH